MVFWSKCKENKRSVNVQCSASRKKAFGRRQLKCGMKCGAPDESVLRNTHAKQGNDVPENSMFESGYATIPPHDALPSPWMVVPETHAVPPCACSRYGYAFAPPSSSRRSLTPGFTYLKNPHFCFVNAMFLRQNLLDPKNRAISEYSQHRKTAASVSINKSTVHHTV